jgi:hypothetical protein
MSSGGPAGGCIRANVKDTKFISISYLAKPILDLTQAGVE